MDKHQAAAAMKRIRDKNAAKKKVHQQAFYDVNNLSTNQGCMKKPVNKVIYDMKSFWQQAVDRYKDLDGPKFHNLKKEATPFHDDKIARPVEAEAEVKGELAPMASRVLMKLLFAARMGDLLRAVQGLASRVSKWSSECDMSLHRLMCYANSTLDVKLRSYIGDPVDHCKLWLFAGADHAGEHDNKSHRGHSCIGRAKHLLAIIRANIALRTVGLPSCAILVLAPEGGGRYSPTFRTQKSSSQATAQELS